MAEEKPEQPENIASPENGAEPDYTGLEEYIIYPPEPNSPLELAIQEMDRRLPKESKKLSVEESLKELEGLPINMDWDSTAMIRRMRDAR